MNRCTFCFDFKEDLQQPRNIHLNICQYSSSTRPPTLGMDLCALPRLFVYSVRAYPFRTYTYKRARRQCLISVAGSLDPLLQSDRSSTPRRLRHSTFPESFFFVYRWQASNWIRKVYVIDRLITCIS